MPPHPLTNFEIQKYYHNKPKSKGAYSRNILSKYKSIETNWIIWYVNDDNITCFGSFGLEYILKEIKKFIGNKNIKTNIYRNKSNAQ